MFKKLLSWSRENHGDLPWRKKRSAYRTLVAETMLQQTTVNTVRRRFGPFLTLFPTLESLAQAREEEVVMAWKGLGYYRRAKNLRRACGEIERQYRGHIPRSLEQLKALPGVGDYTARALISLGTKARALPVDVNIARVLARFYGLRFSSGEKLRRELDERFARGQILQGATHWGDTVEALMDVGRILCRAKKVECLPCPLRTHCKGRLSGEPLSFPTSPRPSPKTYGLKLLRVFVRFRGKFLGKRNSGGQWLSGQIEVPTFVIESEDETFSGYPPLPRTIDLGKAKVFKTSITKYRITNFLVPMSRDQLKQFSPQPYRFFFPDHAKENLSTTTIKICTML